MLRIPSITFSKSTRLKSGCCLSLWSSAANVSSWCFSMEPALDTLNQVMDYTIQSQIQNRVSTAVSPALEGLWLWFSNIWTDSPTKRIFSATRTGMYEGSISTRRENCCRDGASMFSSSISLYIGRTVNKSRRYNIFSKIFHLGKRIWTLVYLLGWRCVYIYYLHLHFKMRHFISTMSSTGMDFNRMSEKLQYLVVR